MASAIPVDAPDGIEAEAQIPPSRRQVARTVGLPRLSRISRPDSRLILSMSVYLSNKLKYQVVDASRRVGDELQNNLLLSRCFLVDEIL
jgi:hypothetical protein